MSVYALYMLFMVGEREVFGGFWILRFFFFRHVRHACLLYSLLTFFFFPLPFLSLCFCSILDSSFFLPFFLPSFLSSFLSFFLILSLFFFVCFSFYLFLIILMILMFSFSFSFFFFVNEMYAYIYARKLVLFYGIWIFKFYLPLLPWFPLHPV